MAVDAADEDEDAMLARAIAMSMETAQPPPSQEPPQDAKRQNN